MSGKLLAILVALVAAMAGGGAWIYLNTTPPTPEKEETIALNIALAEKETPDSTPTENVVQVPVEGSMSAADTIPKDSTEQAAETWLSGHWLMQAVDPPEPLAELAEIRLPLQIKHEDSKVSFQIQAEGDSFNLAGWIRKGYVVLDSKEGELLGHFEGMTHPDKDTFLLKGELFELSLDYPAVPIKFQVTRIAAEREEAMASLAAYKEEMEAVLAALLAYKKEHGKWPEALRDLVPDYLTEAALIRNTKNRRYTYNPTEKEAGNTGAELPREPVYSGNEREYRDLLLAHEAALQKILGKDRIFQKPLLTAQYSHPNAKLSTDGNKVHAPNETRNAAALRASCQNNLKQLGLVAKMFENEHQNYTPPGWYMVYPEYLTDYNILVCPAQAPGTDSYDYFFPATHIDYYLDIYESLSGKTLEEMGPAGTAIVQSSVPLIVERHGHQVDNGKEVRNVLFADGHVEAMTSEAIAERVEPYLRFR